MTSLEDHAARGNGPEIVLTQDLPQEPDRVIASAELVEHDDLTEEGMFPQHGVFLEMENGEEPVFWECTGTLAGLIMEWADEKGTEPEGALLGIDQVSKTPSGEWRFVGALSEASD